MSLLEVVISLSLISISLVFLVKEEVHIRLSMETIYYKSLALSQAVSIRERLRANQSQDYQLREISFWNMENAQILPGGFGEIHCDPAYCFVLINWRRKTLQQMQLKLPR